jgi:hypothetical protein
MNRIKDYAGFAICFVGLGYIVLWPLTSPEFGGLPFGASIFCHDGSTSALDLLCNSTHPLALSSGLHAVGILSAVAVMLRLLSYVIRRSRRGIAGGRESALKARIPVAVAPSTWRKPARPFRPVKPRAQFGLRGTPR